MSTSAKRTPADEQAHSSELRPEALEAVRTIHAAVKSWVPESECTLTDNAAEFPVLFGRCTVSVTPLDVDTWDGHRLSERIEARTELAYVTDDFYDSILRLANAHATTGAAMVCPESGRPVIVSGINVFRDDAAALRTLYVPTLLWSSLVQSFSIQHALRETFGTDLLGEESKQIGMPACNEPSRWQARGFAAAADRLRSNGIFCNESDTALTAEFPWEPDAVSAIEGDRTSLLQFDSGVGHPTAGNGLAFRLVLPVSADEADLPAVADTLNELEIAGVDVPPALGAWAFLPRLNSVAYKGFWLNCMYKPGIVANIASWCSLRNRFARQVLANRN